MIVDLLKGNGVNGVRVELSIFQMQELQDKMTAINELMYPAPLKENTKLSKRLVFVDKMRNGGHEELIKHVEELQVFFNKIAPVPCRSQVRDSLYGVPMLEEDEKPNDKKHVKV